MNPYLLQGSIVMSAAVVAFASPNALGAGVQRSFSDISGNDANVALNCSFVNRCRTAAAALSVLAAGGEAYLLGAGGYSVATITQSASLIGMPGVKAGITGFSGTALTVNAPGGVVVLENLSLNGLGGTVGIDNIDSASLTLRNVEVSRFNIGFQSESSGQVFIDPSSFHHNSDIGLWFNGTGKYLAWDTSIVNNGSGSPSNAGIAVEGPASVKFNGVVSAQNSGPGLAIFNAAAQPTWVDIRAGVFDENSGPGVVAAGNAGAPINVSIEGSEVSRNQMGGVLLDTSQHPIGSLHIFNSVISHNVVSGVMGQGDGASITISNCLVSHNQNDGVALDNLGGSGGKMTLNFNTISDNLGVGVRVNGTGATTVLTNNTISGNAVQGGVSGGGATIFSGQDNIFKLNGVDVLVPPPTPVSKQ